MYILEGVAVIAFGIARIVGRNALVGSAFIAGGAATIASGATAPPIITCCSGWRPSRSGWRPLCSGQHESACVFS